MRRLVALPLLAAALALPAAAAAEVPQGATWTEAYITEADGTKLHADVLRPAGLPADARTPVILTVSPYTNHSGQTSYDETQSGPSNRFFDFLAGAKLLERGYTYVIADLRGTGGSSGCTDWGGPGEQADVKAAVEWAAAQPWSTGKVGMYGKSYDGWTGLMGIAQQPAGLAAVVAQEPVYDGYRYIYMNGVHYANTLLTRASFTAVDAQPGAADDTLDYQLNGLQKDPTCYPLYNGQMELHDDGAGFWRARALVPNVRGLETPLFLTQGLLEDNTKPDAAFDFLGGLEGPKRAWIGQWDHVRGNDVVGGKLAMGRKDFFGEVMRFYDEHLKGIAPVVADPPVAVQGGDGKWRSERTWPPADSRRLLTTLNAGGYADDNANAGTGPNAGKGVWTFSPVLDRAVHLSGIPRVTVDAAVTLPEANLVADVYDVDGAGKATLISRGTTIVHSTGQVSFDLYGEDWPIAQGHRIGVLLSGANSEWWTHVPTRQTVTMRSARILLPFLPAPRASDLPGDPALKLLAYRAAAPFTVPAATVAGATAPFALPPARR